MESVGVGLGLGLGLGLGMGMGTVVESCVKFQRRDWKENTVS